MTSTDPVLYEAPVRMLTPYYEWREGYKKIAFEFLTSGEQVTRTSFKRNNADQLVMAMIAPARQVDLIARYEDFPLYAPGLLRNLRRQSDSRLRVIFHDTAFRSFLTLDPQFAPHVRLNRVELYDLAEKPAHEESLLVTVGDARHWRLEIEDQGFGIARFNLPAEEGGTLQNYFTALKARARALTP
jgi:hypothetical protein